jgi:hypothetical protein
LDHHITSPISPAPVGAPAPTEALAPLINHVVSPHSSVPLVNDLIADITSQFPLLTNVPSFLLSMSKQSSFKQGEPSPNVTMLLERIQFANPGSSGIDEDNQAQNWGHYQFTAGGISPSSALTTWQDFGNVATAFKLVAAALKICQDARAMCADTEMPPDFLCDVFFNQILERLEKCWVGTGGAITSSRAPAIPATPPRCDKATLRLTIKVKPVATTTSPTQKGSAITQPPGAISEPTQELQEPSATLQSHEDPRADAASLKLLQVSELHSWMIKKNLTIPKPKCKDDIIAAIVKTPEFALTSKASIEQIVELHKMKKQLATAP